MMNIKDLHSPQDLASLSVSDLEALAAQIRAALLEKASCVGGHLGPNLGVVELTLALHSVFASPDDKLVFDVSHQTYTHKMLTGRAQAFLEKEHYADVSGFTTPTESEHDQFTIGHTSTSVALALGLAKARDLSHADYNVVAVIGDGALSGGEAFEGLDLAGAYRRNLIIIVNDNNFSIAENHGGIYANLEELRRTKGGASQNYFRALGLRYHYVDDGHDLGALIHALQEAKDTPAPILIHVHTTKGKGYPPAEKNPEKFHSVGPFDKQTGQPAQSIGGAPDAAALFGKQTQRILFRATAEDPRIIALSAATPSMMGYGQEERLQAGEHFIDVGIAEPAAVSLAAGLAKGGAKPVFCVRSSFIQRAFDQIAQDVCIDALPVTFVIFTGSLYAMHDVTHQGFSDIGLLSSVPNLTYLCPTSPQEYEAMLKWSLTKSTGPVAIKLPGLYNEKTIDSQRALPTKEALCPGEIPISKEVLVSQESLSLQESAKLSPEIPSTANSGFCSYQIIQKGKKVALLGLGTFLGLAQETAQLLEQETGIHATVINPRFASGVDSASLERLQKGHRLVVTLEDGRIEGGFGQKIAAFYGTSPMRVLVKGLSQKVQRKYSVETLLRENGLCAPQLVAHIKSVL